MQFALSELAQCVSFGNMEFVKFCIDNKLIYHPFHLSDQQTSQPSVWNSFPCLCGNLLAFLLACLLPMHLALELCMSGPWPACFSLMGRDCNSVLLLSYPAVKRHVVKLNQNQILGNAICIKGLSDIHTLWPSVVPISSKTMAKLSPKPPPSRAGQSKPGELERESPGAEVEMRHPRWEGGGGEAMLLRPSLA